jgi:hypothetical protein
MFKVKCSECEETIADSSVSILSAIAEARAKGAETDEDGDWTCEDCLINAAEAQHEHNMSEFYGGSRPHPADRPSNPLANYLRQKGEY